jgi:hypothetical protein
MKCQIIGVWSKVFSPETRLEFTRRIVVLSVTLERAVFNREVFVRNRAGRSMGKLLTLARLS